MHRTIPTLVMLAGTAAFGQECFWKAPEQPIPSGILLYDKVQERVLSVGPGFVVRAFSGDQWKTIPTVGAPNHGGPLVFDSARGRIVQCGGGGGTVYFNDTWEWDGQAWMLVSETGPNGTGSLAFDEARGKVVRFHQVTGSGPGQTWLWDGVAWTMAAWSGPMTGYYPMVYDSDREVVVLLGRNVGGMREVWEWDGFQWERRPDAPLSTTGGVAVYDTVRRKLVLHVGGSQNIISQTWECDFTTGQWQQTTTGGPWSGQFVFDSARGTALLSATNPFAGSFSWEWNGNGTISPVVITQHPASVQLYPGETLTLSVAATTTGTPTYQWFRNEVPLTNSGAISGADTAVLRISPVTTEDRGAYHAVVGNQCFAVPSNQASVYIPGEACYANCDGSTVLPVLTANDFMCFMNHFANQSEQANCDGSTGFPRLTASDFQCYMDRFAAGCP